MLVLSSHYPVFCEPQEMLGLLEISQSLEIKGKSGRLGCCNLQLAELLLKLERSHKSGLLLLHLYQSGTFDTVRVVGEPETNSI